jgi:hypothetical protein
MDEIDKAGLKQSYEEGEALMGRESFSGLIEVAVPLLEEAMDFHKMSPEEILEKRTSEILFQSQLEILVLRACVSTLI